MTLEKFERETVIRSSAADKEWDLCTADPRIIRYLKRQGYDLRDDYQNSDYLHVIIPFNKVRFSRRVSTRKGGDMAKVRSRRKEPVNNAAVDASAPLPGKGVMDGKET